MKSRRLAILVAICSSLFWTACGGGGGGTTSTVKTSSSTPPTITTTSPLPGTLQGNSYSATLKATGGTGALHWSIAAVSSTTLFPTGLSINADTGVISGTADFSGTASFVATVKDSASPPQSATKSYNLTAYQPLTAPATQPSQNLEQYAPMALFGISSSGGVPPLTFSVTGGTLPPGVRLSSAGTFSGSATTLGTYPLTVTIQDSFSPQETASTEITLTVVPPALSMPDSLPLRVTVNSAFSGQLVANGGAPPYTFAVLGSLPPGLTLDGNTGLLTGVPTRLGSFSFSMQATDSASATATFGHTLNVLSRRGRNDTIQTASLIGNGQAPASISPYMDPPVVGSRPGDSDYYELRAAAGATVHVETFAKRFNPQNPLDTVLEIVDANGVRLTTCRLPGATSTLFNSPCLNDDISFTPEHVQDSALDLQVPAATTQFYVHVLDWRGDARPDMSYTLDVTGVTEPLKIITDSLPGETSGSSYNQQLFSSGGTSPVTWTLAAGSLPPGLSLSSGGLISGTSSTNGSYAFTVQAADSGNPAQTASRQYTIEVADPVSISSSPTLPDACANQPYSFTGQTTGGVEPFTWLFSTSNWPANIKFDIYTGTFSGTATVTGAFTGTLSVRDNAGSVNNQSVSLTVKTCP